MTNTRLAKFYRLKEIYKWFCCCCCCCCCCGKNIILNEIRSKQFRKYRSKTRVQQHKIQFQNLSSDTNLVSKISKFNHERFNRKESIWVKLIAKRKVLLHMSLSKLWAGYRFKQETMDNIKRRKLTLRVNKRQNIRDTKIRGSYTSIQGNRWLEVG